MDSARFGLDVTPNNHPIAFHVIDSGVCHQIMFKDPDGNVLGLHHRYA